ncbi:Na/Pi cotransporter family protein [Seohaeicola nanhaiensis]|uniref:Na/Pi cotransporter family protein n=1 Tax=Seohaeicola nanhaiensis TaxID=1387282 RepID=A0ABV9KEB6_9RHOB
MSGLVFFLHMAGAVALLLAATRMVRTGVERAYGRQLRQHLRQRIGHPLSAMLMGLVMAVALQSSTAVTLLVSSFVGLGLVSGVAGIVIVRGGELGSALVAKVLSFDLTLLAPALLTLGAVLYLRSDRRPWHEIGRCLLGIALILISLEMVSTAALPLRDSTFLPVVVRYLSGDILSCFLLAAALTYLLHSSIAAVLLLAAMAEQGVLPPGVGLVMVLGVNLGSSMIAPVLTRAAAPEQRAVPLANLLMRGLGSVVLLALYEVVQPDPALLGTGPANQIIHAHIAFNLFILLVGLPLSGVAWRISRWVADLRTPIETGPAHEEISALDPAALGNPDQALANATREAIRMCDTIDTMLSRIIEVYAAPDPQSIADLRAFDDRVDNRHNAIKLYLARITEQGMTEAQSRRCQDLLEVCIKLEQAGDVIVRNLLLHAQKKMERQVEFTPEGWKELVDFHASVMRNARLAFNLLVDDDPATAQQVIIEKDRLRDSERETRQQHFMRLRRNTEQSIETSSIHLDTVRDLKQINGLLAALAYPVLEEQGLLRGSRLKKPA